jgi:DNA polymerase-3 subunit delta'
MSDRDDSLHPRLTQRVCGHEDRERLLLADWQRGTLPGAYMFCGARGIGKSSMAYRLARFLLATPAPGEAKEPAGLFGDALPPIIPNSLAVDAEHPAARKIAAGAHPNLLVIEPGYDEKKKKPRQEILIGGTRKIGNFLSLSASEHAMRIVLIDAADELNTNAANSILKWLEEPPAQTLFILIAHHPGALLPTIRSRCRAVTFRPPSPEEFGRILEAQTEPLDERQKELLYTLASGAPGRAVLLHHAELDTAYAELLDLLALPCTEAPEMERYAGHLLERRKELPFEMVTGIVRAALAGIIRERSGAQRNDSSPAAFRVVSTRKPLEYWLDLWEKSNRLLADTQRLHLDAKRMLGGVLVALAGKEGILDYLHEEA